MKTKIIFSLIMSAMMAFTMSLIMTFINIGLVDDFIFRWLRAFCIGFSVAFPTSLMAAPIARKIINKIDSDKHERD